MIILDECVKMCFLAYFRDHLRNLKIPTEMNYVVKFGPSESVGIHVRFLVSEFLATATERTKKWEENMNTGYTWENPQLRGKQPRKKQEIPLD